jgi:O-acetyl-ADP-ribose deacetylase (regulator of RNase III)
VVDEKMTITEIHDNIFNIRCEAIVNAVNTVGVMGGGLALQFKNRYPLMFEGYRKLCKSGEFKIGDLYVYQGKEQIIVNFPTKDHYMYPSELEFIEKGMDALIEFLLQHEFVRSIAIPKLGCGLGGLDWNDVKKIIIKKFKDADGRDQQDLIVYLVV